VLREIASKNPPVDREAIRLFAGKRLLNLPGAYVDFLANSNGGRPRPAHFPRAGLRDNPSGRIQVFFGLYAAIATSDLDLVLDDLPPTVPKELLPIACTEGYDFICLDMRKSPAAVMYWNKRAFWGNEIWRESHLYNIAPNFEDFLDALHDD
jgi:hypothetical protein